MNMQQITQVLQPSLASNPLTAGNNVRSRSSLQILTPDDSRWMQILQQYPHDIYHRPGYLQLEAARYGARAEALWVKQGSRSLFLPYLVRPIASASGHFDVISPYGYSGVLLQQADAAFLRRAIAQVRQYWRSEGICSAFLRFHPILNAELLEGAALPDPPSVVLGGETVTLDLSLSESEQWGQYTGSQRNKVRKAEREGLTAQVIPFAQGLEAFLALYEQTMHRVGAQADYYSFDRGYFTEMSQTLGSHLHLCTVTLEEQVICASLYSECNGVVQSLFRGSASEFLKHSPSSLEVHQMRQWSSQQGWRYLHLGGGVGSSQGDGVFKFKASFSHLRHRFFTQRWILDPVQYRMLTEHQAQHLQVSPQQLLDSNFFPAYRAIAA